MKSFQQQEKKDKQLKDIYNAIVNGDSKNKFKVFGTEAGLGKTTTIENSLVDLYRIAPNVKTLLVKPFRDKEDPYASYKRINELAGKKIAVAIDSTNYKENRDKLKEYPVVIITHSRYKKLCKNQKEREIFASSRKNLIIDEEIEMIKLYQIGKKEIVEMEGILESLQNGNQNAKDIYSDIVREVEFKLIAAEKGIQLVYFEDKLIEDKIKHLKNFISNFADEDYFLKLKEEKNIDVQLNKVLGYIENLEAFFNNNSVIMTNNKIYTYDSNIKYFLLENNIMLDASAYFNYIYHISNYHEVIMHSRIVEHDKTTINVCYLNTTKSAKVKYLNFNQSIIEHIKQKCPNDKVLIVGLKDEVKKLEQANYEEIESQIEFTNFKYMRGKNEWKDFNKCYIIHTPNMNYCYYLFLYQFFTGRTIEESDLVLKRNEFGNIGFDNEEIEKIRKTYVASEVYQAVKRVNRGNEHLTQIYLIISDKEIVRLVSEQLSGAYIHEFMLEIEKHDRKEYNNDSRFLNSYAGKLLKFFLTAPEGEYSKEEVRLEIGWEVKKTFAEKVISKVIKYIDENNLGIVLPSNKEVSMLISMDNTTVVVSITTRKFIIQ